MFRMPRRLVLLLLLSCLTLSCLPCRAQSSAAPSAAAAPARSSAHEQLARLFDTIWQWRLRESPEFATYVGDKRYNDRLSDYSIEAVKRQTAQQVRFASQLRAIPEAGLSEEDALDRSLMLRNLDESIESTKLKLYEMPVSQFGGIHLEMASLPHDSEFTSAKDYDDYIARLHQVPRAVEQNIALMRAGMADKLMPPKYLLPTVAEQSEKIAVTGEQSPFAEPLTRFPAAVSAADRERIRGDVMKAVDNEVAPAFAKFAKFVREEYAPHGRTEPGVWSLPNGDAIYRFAIRQQTTTDRTPEDIHQFGMREVARIEREMTAIAQKQGYKDRANFDAAIRKDPSHYGKSGEQILGLYKKYVDQMYPKLPQLFGHLPKNRLEVVPMQAFRAGASVPADYSPGSPEAGRPGRVNVNEFDPTHRLLLNVEAIAYHEGIPGHHLQFSIAQEQKDVPPFRRYQAFNAFSEGWAFYAERLAKDVGFYQDPYSDYGRLQNEMWRAVRLVVDTGVHEQHWSRQQMIDFFHQHTTMDDLNIQTEVDRYIAWPAQALGYKLGQQQILDLRAQAQRELGARFDLRAFHDAVLAAGSIPLDVLRERMTAWIAAQKTGSKSSAAGSAAATR